MNKHLYLALFLTSVAGYAQNAKTGIGTVDPQQTLHVAAPKDPVLTPVGGTGVFIAKPTVRVDGLNSTNNTANQPTDPNSLKRVYANQTGDLVLVNGKLEQQIIIQEILDPAVPAVDPVPVKEIVSSVVLGGFDKIELKSVAFTLTQPSVVYFSASFAALIRQTNVLLQPVTITDGRAKLYGAYFQFSATDSGISTIAPFGRNRKIYSNGDANPLTFSDTDGVSGDFVLNPRAKLILPKGTYTVKLYGELYMSTLSLLERAQFGGGTVTTGENFLINATPIQYQ